MAQVPMINLPHITPVSQIASRVAQGNLASLQGDALQQQNQQKAQEFQRSQSLNALKQQGLTDPKARAIASRLDPDYGKKLQAYEAAQQDYETKKAVFWGGQTQAALDTGIAQVPGFYKKIYDKAAQSGEDMTEAPLPSNDLSLRPTDAQIQYLEFIAKRGISAKNQLEMKQKQEAEKQKLQRGVNLPSDARSYLFYKGLSSGEQQDFLNVKRDVYKTGLTTDEQGGIVPMPGITGAKTDIKAAESKGTAIGKIQGEDFAQANVDLPQVLDKANYAIKLLNALEKHEGLSDVVGIKGGGAVLANVGLGIVSGTKAADFEARFEQVQGQKFLEAYESLKGAGQITEIEGNKATQAISRLKTSQSEKEFKEAISELKTIINKGVSRAKNKTKEGKTRGSQSNNNDPLGIR